MYNTHRVIHMSATVIITSLEEWAYLVFGGVVHTGEIVITTDITHFQQFMH